MIARELALFGFLAFTMLCVLLSLKARYVDPWTRRCRYAKAHGGQQ